MDNLPTDDEVNELLDQVSNLAVDRTYNMIHKTGLSYLTLFDIYIAVDTITNDHSPCRLKHPITHQRMDVETSWNSYALPLAMRLADKTVEFAVFARDLHEGFGTMIDDTAIETLREAMMDSMRDRWTEFHGDFLNTIRREGLD